MRVSGGPSGPRGRSPAVQLRFGGIQRSKSCAKHQKAMQEAGMIFIVIFVHEKLGTYWTYAFHITL